MKSKFICVFLLIACPAENSFAQWQQTHGSPQYGAAAFAANGQSVFVASYNGGGVYRSADNGGNWTQVNNGLTCDSVYAIAISGNTVFAGTYDSYLGDLVSRSTNNGDGWTPATTGLVGGYSTSFAVLGSDLFVSMGYTGGVFHSTNSGDGWTALNNALVNRRVSTLAAIGADLFAGTDSGAFVSNDSGTTWTLFGLAGAAITGFSNIGSVIFAASPDAIHRTTDHGLHWTSANLTSVIYTVMAVGHDLFTCGSRVGVQVSTDSGTTWNLTGFPGSLEAISLGASGPFLLAGTRNSGIWRLSLSDFADVRSNLIDPSIELSPNPTTGLVTVQPAGNTTHMTITNLLGQPLIELSNSGAASFTLDLSKLPAGTYFARFSIGGEIVTKKIVKN